MLKLVIPLVHVTDSTAAEKSYRQGLGFQLPFAHRTNEAMADPCYMGLMRDGIRLHVSSFAGDGLSGTVVNFLVEDVDMLHAEFAAKRIPVDTGPVDQSWGTREM